MSTAILRGRDDVDGIVADPRDDLPRAPRPRSCGTHLDWPMAESICPCSSSPTSAQAPAKA